MYRRFITRLIGTVAILFVAATFTLAEDDTKEASGTVIEVNAVTGEYTIKDEDGKTHVVKKADIIAKDLKTGDTVVYKVIAGAPANVRKQG